MSGIRNKNFVNISEPQTPKSQLALSVELRNVINERNILTTKTKRNVLRALDEIKDNENEILRKNIKEKVVQEILSSEVNYLNCLEIIINFFMKPIKERNIISYDAFQILFGSIETIYKINGQLLHELKKNLTSIVKAFSNMALFFKMYSVYAYEFKKSLLLLQKLQVENYEFSKFLSMQESRPEVQSKLSALLITPIQRIPRYRLLLMQVLEHTSKEDNDYDILVDSLKKIESVVKHIDTLVDEQENVQRMLELQRSLINNKPVIIKPGRKLIKEGILMKISQKGTHSYKRYFVLMSDLIMYCKMKNHSLNGVHSLKCSSIFPLSKCKFTEIIDKGCFKINCQNEEIILYDSSLAGTLAWIKALKNTYNNYVDNRKTLRKDSTIKRLVTRKDIDEYSDYGLSPGIKRTKRILEKEQFEDVFKNIANDSEDSDATVRSCFPIKKRKTCKTNNDNSERKVKTDKYVKDSLYPLRKHLKNENDDIKTDENTKVSVSNNNEIFVFGSNNTPKSFTFKIYNYISEFGNCFKKVLGFK